MRRRFAALGVLVAGTIVWLLLRGLIPRGSERFYLLIPPVFLAAGWLLGFLDQGRVLQLARCVGIFFCIAALAPFAQRYLQRQNGSSALVPVGMSGDLVEIIIGTYFALAIFLLLSAPWLAIRSVLFGKVDTSSTQTFGLPVLVPTLVVLILAQPYLMATAYIHRVKVPSRENPQSYAQRAYVEESFEASDGTVLRCWFIPAKAKSARTLLFCHGIGASMWQSLGYLPLADSLDANLFSFDFRGHGASDGHTCSIGRYETLDVLAAVKHLREQHPEDCRELIGFAVSMGTSALLHAAPEVTPPFSAVICDSALANAGELADNVIRGLPPVIRPLLTFVGVPIASLEAGCWLTDVSPESKVASIRAPLLLIHSKGDPLIPSSHSERLFAVAAAPKLLWVPEIDGHGNAFHALPDEYLVRVRKFLNSP